MARKEYTDAQKNDFVELAQEIGIGRAIKDLGYPSWPAGRKWCEERGVVPSVDTLMQSVKQYHTFYETTDALIVVEQGIEVVQEKLLTSNLEPDDVKKLSESLQKLVNSWLVLQGKAGTITETVKKDTIDTEIAGLVEEMKKKNLSKTSNSPAVA